jgi:hypothetical protein
MSQYVKHILELCHFILVSSLWNALSVDMCITYSLIFFRFFTSLEHKFSWFLSTCLSVVALSFKPLLVVWSVKRDSLLIDILERCIKRKEFGFLVLGCFETQCLVLVNFVFVLDYAEAYPSTLHTSSLQHQQGHLPYPANSNFPQNSAKVILEYSASC